MAWDSWPSADHPSTTLAEFERTLWEDSGVIGTPADSAVVYADSSGRQVKTRLGKWLRIHGFTGYTGSSDTTLAVAANSSGSDRTDIVVARLDRGGSPAGEITPVVKTGTTALTQNEPGGSPDYWEEPLATVVVPNGAVTLAAGAVHRRERYQGPNVLVVPDEDSLPPVRPGLIVAQYDQTKLLAALGADYRVLYEDTGITEVSGLAGGSYAVGWANPGGSLPGVTLHRFNGMVTLVCVVQRSGGSIASNAASVIATLPAAYRPRANTPVLGYMTGPAQVQLMVNAAGSLELQNHGAAVANSYLIYAQTVTYPAA